MKEYYTAVGKFESRLVGYGKRYPVIIVGGKEVYPNVQELLVWTFLNWNILTELQIEDIYNKKCKESALFNCGYNIILKRLLNQGLVVQGIGNADEDAIYDLLSDLYVTLPQSYNFITKVISLLKIVLVKHIPFHKALTIFRKEKMNDDEKRVVDLAKQTALTSSEIIKCIENNVYDISNDNKLMDVLYNDDDTTSDNIGLITKTFNEKSSVISAIANLYLHRRIIFQRI